MSLRRVIPYLLAAGLLVAILAAAGYWLSSPRLAEASPFPGAAQVSAGSPLRLRFTRPMSPESLQAGLRTDPPRQGSFAWEDARTVIFTPSQPWPNESEVRVTLGVEARSAGWIPLGLLGQRAWSFYVGSPWLAYLSPADGPADLYAVNPANEEILRLSDFAASVVDYHLAPGGATIYLSVNRGAAGSAIYRLDRLSGESTALLECPQADCRGVRVSPDGQTLAYERAGRQGAGRSQVWLLPLGVLKGEPYLAAGADEDTSQPDWSPDGRLIYHSAGRQAFILRSPGGGEILSMASLTGIPGAWNPQGSLYVYPEVMADEIRVSPVVTGLVTIPATHLLQVELPGGARRDLTVTDDLEDTTPAFSPDGGLLAFARKRLNLADWTPGRQIWLRSTASGDAAAVTDEPAYNHYGFAWRPDGGQLAYVRFNVDLLTEPPEIWLMSSAGSGKRRVVSDGYAPQWLP
jgi:Tol biopolymer transport system component